MAENGVRPGTADSDSESDEDLEDIAKHIAEQFELEDEMGPNVNDSVASVVRKLLEKPASEQALKHKLDKIKRPANCDALQTPKLNSEIWGMLKSGSRSKEIRLHRMQNKIVKATTQIAMVISSITDESLGKKARPVDVKTLITNLFGVVGILGSAIQDTSQQRKEEIRWVLPKKFKAMCSAQQPVTSKLFGDDLAKVVKDLNETNRLSQNLMDKPSYNFKGQSKFASKGKHFLGNRRHSSANYNNKYQKKNWSHDKKHNSFNKTNSNAK